MRFFKIFPLAACVAAATFAHAQFSQPWTPNAKGFVSRVISCTNPIPTPGAAYDDFISSTNSNLNVLIWWGNVSSPAQLTKSYYVAIYNNLSGACFPNLSGMVYSSCVTPLFTFPFGTDCQGNIVYVFVSFLPGGATVVPGQQYWLQISEDDASSVTPGVDDFRWCGHFANVMCPAMQIGSGAVNSPLQGCGALCDLAFRIF